jgi:hypothetical protein
MGIVLAVVAVATFTPRGESASPFEAATLQLFVSAALFACSAVGYACAIGLVARQHATLRLPFMFGVITGAVTFAFAAVGGVNQVARATGLSVFAALAVLGFLAGIAASPLVILAARMFPNPRRA